MGPAMRDAYISANRLLYTKMKGELGDEIKKLKGVNPIQDGQDERVISINDGDAMSFIEGTIFKHSVDSGRVMLNVKAKTALLNLYAFVELDDRNLESIINHEISGCDGICAFGGYFLC